MDDERNELLAMFKELRRHREQLRQDGYDPDYIGVTEVQPLHCPCCGKPIPWALLNLYR